MRLKDDDLFLVDRNLKTVEANPASSIQESTYHMVKNCSAYTIDGVTIPMFSNDMSYLVDDSYLQTKHTVQASEVGRLDKISYQYYKTPELWWLIAEVNYLDPFELQEGQEIVIPSLRQFEFKNMFNGS